MPGVDPAVVSGTLPLRDIHLPPPPDLWPPAPGWWCLVGLLVLLLFALFVLLRYVRRLHYRRQALKQLAALARDEQISSNEFLREISALLRRAVLCAFERRECAGLTGEDWLQFLDRGFSDAPFSTGVGRVLSLGPYQKTCDFDRTALLALCQRRLRKLPAAPRQRRSP